MKNKNSKSFIIFKIIGFSLLGLGAILLISGITKKVPSMSADNWFEMQTRKTSTIFGGIACLMFSVPLILAGFSHKKFDQQNMLDELNNNASEINKKPTETKYCEYCGQAIPENSNTCKNCGAKHR